MWYAELIRPSFAPPAFVFGPVWAVLYVGIVASFGYVFYLAVTRKIPLFVAVPFAFNLAANLLYSPIMFGLRDIAGGTIMVLLVLGSLIWAMGAIWPYAKWVTFVQIPYFAWVCFASVLQISVLILN